MTSAFYDLAAVARPVAVSLSTMGGQGSKITRDSSGGERFVVAKGHSARLQKKRIPQVTAARVNATIEVPARRRSSISLGGAKARASWRLLSASVWSAACARRRRAPSPESKNRNRSQGRK
jgi:hypothetical protein